MLDFVRNYLPLVIAFAIIGSFTVVFLLAWLALKKKKDPSEDNDRKMADTEIIKRTLLEEFHRCSVHHAVLHCVRNPVPADRR